MKDAVAPWQRVMHCMRIVCRNGLVVRLVDYPFDVVISGMTYTSDAGYQFTGVEEGSTFTPGAVDFSSMVGISPDITIPKIQSGFFDKATMLLFATDWANPVVDEEKIFKGTFGKVVLQGNRYTTEIMNLIDLLNATVGHSYSATCEHIDKFGGQEFGGCKVDKDALQVSGALTSVTDNFTFADSARTEVDDWFGYGELWFTTGANVGVMPLRVQDYTQSGGGIVMTEPFPFPPQAGDEYEMTPGCRGRLDDCKKYNNVARRRAFDNIPGERFLKLVGGM